MAILGGLGGQEGEYRQMQKQKKKKKFWSALIIHNVSIVFLDY